MELIFFTLSIFILIIYSFTILAFFFGWQFSPNYKHTSKPHYQPISIIIVFCDEITRIEQCLNSLIELQYPKNKMEFIFVDDFSKDNTANFIHNFFNNHSDFHYQVITNNSQKGKKTAIKIAITAAKYNLIAQTDADCIVPPFWLNIFNDFYNRHSYKMIVAPIVFYKPKTILEQLQQIELGSLMVSTGGAINIGQPIMCNAANLFYEKQVFIDLQKEMEPFMQYPSGDDVFFLHACKERYGCLSIGFIKSLEICVQTFASPTLQTFFYQRARWGGKTPHYKDKFAFFTASIVAGLSICIILTFLGAIFMNWSFIPPLILFSVKILIDFPVIYSWLAFIHNKKLIKYYPLLSFLYPLYITYIIVLMIFNQNNWKH